MIEHIAGRRFELRLPVLAIAAHANARRPGRLQAIDHAGQAGGIDIEPMHRIQRELERGRTGIDRQNGVLRPAHGGTER